jgi:glutamine synthetase adenylyltransferase
VLDLQVCLDLILTLTQKKENFVCQLFEMTSYLNLNDTIFISLLCILRHFQNQTINTIALRCILNILKNVKQQTYLNSCWELIEKMWVENKEAETGIQNFLFSV